MTVDFTEHSPETIRKAFWLQEKIRREGTPAVRFMATAEQTLERQAPEIVERHISASLKRL